MELTTLTHSPTLVVLQLTTHEAKVIANLLCSAHANSLSRVGAEAREYTFMTHNMLQILRRDIDAVEQRFEDWKQEVYAQVPKDCIEPPSTEFMDDIDFDGPRTGKAWFNIMLGTADGDGAGDNARAEDVLRALWMQHRTPAEVFHIANADAASNVP